VEDTGALVDVCLCAVVSAEVVSGALLTASPVGATLALADAAFEEGQSLSPSWEQRCGRESAPQQAVHDSLRSTACVAVLAWQQFSGQTRLRIAASVPWACPDASGLGAGGVAQSTARPQGGGRCR